MGGAGLVLTSPLLSLPPLLLPPPSAHSSQRRNSARPERQRPL